MENLTRMKHLLTNNQKLNRSKGFYAFGTGWIFFGKNSKKLGHDTLLF